MLVALFVLFLFLLFILSWMNSRPRNAPPGPPGFPFVGNLPSMLPDAPKKIFEWSKTYGPTLSVMVGSRLQVVLHDYDTIKSVFSTESSAGRDQESFFTKLHTSKGFLGFEGELWRQHRRFASFALRDLGVGTGSSWLEDAILDEISEVTALYSSHHGQPFDPRPHLTLSMSNVICAMAFGKRFEHSDDKFLRLCGLVGKQGDYLEAAAPVQIFPILRHLPGKIGRAYTDLGCQIEEIRVFLKHLVDEHNTNTSDRTGNGDFIGLYMAEMDKQSNSSNSTMNVEELLGSLMSLFVAGTDTSTVTLTWSMIYMIENPEVLAKVHEEIDVKIGRNRPIRMSDKAILTYTEAVLLEVQRLASVAPLSVPHTNIEPMKIDGFDIPARTVLSASVYSVHRDPRFWKYPNEFYPEHFIDSNGSLIIPKGFIPFGIGKRMCLGESLAKMQTFLFFTNIVQKFDIQRAPGSTISSEKYITPFVRMPLPFEICFVPR